MNQPIGFWFADSCRRTNAWLEWKTDLYSSSGNTQLRLCICHLYTWIRECMHAIYLDMAVFAQLHQPSDLSCQSAVLPARDEHELGSSCPPTCSIWRQWPSECWVCWVTGVQAGTYVKSSTNQMYGYFLWPYRKGGSLLTLRTMAMNQMFRKETTASECPAELVKSSGIPESKLPSPVIEKMGTMNAPAQCVSLTKRRSAGHVGREMQILRWSRGLAPYGAATYIR